MQHRRLTIRAMSAFFIGMMVVAAPLETAALAVSPNALPPDATGCTGTLSSNQIENCVAIVGDASYLQSVKGSARTHFGSVTGHEEITGPSIPNAT